MQDLKIEPMKKEDIKEVVEIEKVSFPSPWSKEMFHQELKKNSFSYFFVVKKEGRVIGYGGFWLLLDEAHIVNLCIHPMWRRKGIGTLLLQHILKEAKKLGASSATLEVRKSNIDAQRFYKNAGFFIIGRRVFYYSDTGEDALLMKKWLE